MGIAPAEAADSNNGTVESTAEAKGSVDQDPEAKKRRMTMVFLQLVTSQQHLVSTVLGIMKLGWEPEGEAGGGAGVQGRSEQGERLLGWG